ncbi:MAG: hypothetical protein J6I89_03180 [Oscillospiraceae bacterium]|nr:hypothetical protein [Oscillospiraceae bacterium]
MNEYDLFDAFGGVDADLLERSERRPVRRLPLRKALIAAAAVMVLAMTAIAAPGIMDLLFGSEIELLHKGIMYVDNESGISFARDALYEVDMTLPCAETAPTSILEYRLPAYFAENNWSCNSSYVDIDRDNLFGTYVFDIDEAPEYWVFFQQTPFNQMPVRGTAQFLMSAGRTGAVIEQSIAIGDVSGTMYLVEPSDADGEPGQKNLVWSDGEYAYLMQCGWSVTDEMIAEIVLSLAPVEDITLYATEDSSYEIPEEKRLPIDTFYTLTSVPDGYALVDRSWDINTADQLWEKTDRETISLFQDRVISEYNCGPSLDISTTLADVMTSLSPYDYDTATENGQLYHIIYQQGDTFAMWQTEEYVFMLRFNGQKLTTEEMMEHLRSIQPMPDFADHLTD